jgi:maltose/maltodextrin transport system substrate-binding protein
VSSALAPAVHARPARPLTVWFTVEGAKAMRRIGEGFTAATGVPVVIETPDEGPAKFQQAASAGSGPDIYVYAHDRIGEWVAGGLLHAVTPNAALEADIDPLAWAGFRHRGRLWGYPIAVEAITLVYNRALVPRPPATWDEVIALDEALKPSGRRAILWDYTTPYFSFPLLAAGGGYAFKPRPGGGHDPRDTGVAHPGAVAGAALIARLLREGRMPAGSGYAEMEAAMARGRVAMMINGPWSWVNLRRLGIDFGVARIPRLGGQPARPFVGIKGLMVNRATRQRELAVEFIEHWLLSPQGLAAINQAEPLGAPASRRFFDQLAVDPKIAGIMASARDGVPTPSIPEMGRFWAAMKSSLTTLSEGRLDAPQAMALAAQRILAP